MPCTICHSIKKFLILSLGILAVAIYSKVAVSQSNPIVDEIDWRDDDQFLAVGYTDGTIEIIDINSNVIGTISAPDGRIYELEWSHNGKYLASSHEDTTARVWDIETRDQILLLDDYYTSSSVLSWDLADTQLTVFPVEEPAQIVDISNGQVIIEQRLGSIVSTQLDSTGTKLVLGSAGGRIFIYDAHTLQQLNVYGEAIRENFSYDQVTTVAWHPSEPRVIGGSLYGNISVWDTEKDTLVTQLVGTAHPQSTILDVSFDIAENYFISIAEDGTLRTWDTMNWSLITEETLPSPITDAQFSSDGRHLAYTTDTLTSVELIPVHTIPPAQR